jgi:hypothetical protein
MDQSSKGWSEIIYENLITDEEWDSYEDYIRLGNIYFDTMMLVAKEVIEDMRNLTINKPIILNNYIKYYYGRLGQSNLMRLGQSNLMENIKNKVEKMLQGKFGVMYFS